MHKTAKSTKAETSLFFGIKQLFMVSVFLVFLSASVSAVGSITVSPNAIVHVGDTVRISSGTAYSPGSAYISATLNGTLVSLTADASNGTVQNANGTINASSSGAWNATFTVPNLGYGDWTLNASNQTAGDNATTLVSVNQSITSMDINISTVGGTVTFAGTGFHANDTLNVTFNGTLGNLTSGFTVSSTGVVALTVRVPNLGKGTYTVQINGTANSTGAYNASSFNVTSAITSVSPSSGAVGDSITIIGTGFILSSAMRVWIGETTSTITAGSVSGANGAIAITVTVPSVAAPATLDVKVNSTNDSSGATSAGAFTTTAPAAVTSSGPAVGTTIPVIPSPPSGTNTFQSVKPGTPAVTTITKSDLPVTEISINVNAGASGVTVSVVKEEGLPATVSVAAPGSVYAYLKIEAKNLPAASIDNAKVKFTVPKSWVTANGLDVSTITLNRFADGAWNALPTTQLSSDADNYYFEATTPGFSTFAVTGTTAPATTPVTPPVTPPAAEDCRTLGCFSGYECKLIGTAYQCAEVAAPVTPTTPPTTSPTTPVTPPATEPVVAAAPDYTSTIVVVVVVLVIVGAAGYMMMRRPKPPISGEKTLAQKVSEKAKRLSR